MLLAWVRKIWLPIILLVCITACDDNENKDPKPLLQLATVRIGPYNLSLDDQNKNTAAPVDQPIVAAFNAPLDIVNTPGAVELISANGEVPLTFSFLDNNKTFSAEPETPLEPNKQYSLVINDQLKGENGETFSGHTIVFTTSPDVLDITSFSIAGTDALTDARITNIPLEETEVEIIFSNAIDPSTVNAQNIRIAENGSDLGTTITITEENKKIVISITEKLKDLTRYQVIISDQLKGRNSETIQQSSKVFYTAPDPIPDFPIISDNELLTLVQQQTFKYFWEFGHPVSGLARERNTSGDVVTSGGSGFGIMSIIVGIERNFITRSDGVDRIKKMVTFLESADRFHGAWSHWINGSTGDVIPFSQNDNGGDLVETSYLIQGLLTFRQYLQPGDTVGNNLINRITNLYNTVEWNWYRQNNQSVLYWHWSIDKGWIMNHRIEGYNEALITYVMSAGSQTYGIDKPVYDIGWARNGNIVNGKNFYGITLPLGTDFGGPLFFAHYSFLGLDPRMLSDAYANYWTQNVNHTQINLQYCIDNPHAFVGYDENCWGLTASDNQQGYSAHSPTNDLGVITPTAALSSFPYAPDESMKALKFFYYTIGDRLWGEYGFYDAFNLTDGWIADSYLAIDQGPIVVMIENYRSALLWELFMSAPEVQLAKTNLGLN
jgi:hypothetical protein